MLVYFVEDDHSISYIIDKTLEKMDLEKQGFQTGSSFLEAFENNAPDLIILDIMLPDISGLELLKKVRRHNMNIPIIILSALFSEMDKVTALDLGADDYITKPFGILELTSRIQAKLRNVNVVKDLVCEDLRIDTKAYKVYIADKEITLTNKEYQILLYLIKRPNEVLTKEQIFYEVWDTTFMGQSRALDMHVKSLRKKMANANSKIAIQTEYGIGFKLGCV